MSTFNTDPTFQQGECPVCLQEEALFILPCTDTSDSHTGYCQNCHVEALRNLQEGDPLPECPTCSDAIPFRAFQSILSPEQYTTMNTRMLEWGTPADQRLYCSNTDCLKFIPASAPTSGRGSSCTCGTVTCFACKGNAHDGACPEDEGLSAAIETALNNGAKPSRNRAEQEAITLAEQMAFAQLSAEFSDREFNRMDHLLDVLHVTAIIHGEYLIRTFGLDDIVRIGLSLHQGVLEEFDMYIDDSDQYEGIALVIMEARNHSNVISYDPTEDAFARNREALRNLLQTLSQTRSANFNAAAQEASEMLSLYYDQDPADARRFYETVLYSYLGSGSS
ncbi:hypothetical protein KCU65_g5678, partial [Aureobasidium melanogenum]